MNHPNKFLLTVTLLCLTLSSVEAGTTARKALRGQVSSSDRQLEKSRMLKKDNNAGCNGKGNPHCNDPPPTGPEDPVGVPCGKSTCQDGKECCSPSCGYCVEEGTVCMQAMCP